MYGIFLLPLLIKPLDWELITGQMKLMMKETQLALQ